ncbi:ribonuclease PH [Candidatus Desantisbacteria bacterium]|nr:ribonuclease PH [Candidatus Desantisbacteria bacterium]
MKRTDGRGKNELRKLNLIRNYLKFSGGSVLVEFGDTRVICTAFIEPGVPSFLRGKEEGWLTSEYSMLPGSNRTRIMRESSAGKIKGRTHEIQRLIGRSLRAVIDLKKIGENTIWIDCDVIQADGGTRTSSISGAYVALYDAVKKAMSQGLFEEWPIKNFIGAVSVGIVNGEFLLDLDYSEDSQADVDMNVVMTDKGHLIEVQGTAERKTFSIKDMEVLMKLARNGIKDIIKFQKSVLKV